jgi:uncharacterized membrane protein YedE/YeeE
MSEALASPWPWYLAGPIIGLTVPILLLFGGKVFGLSSNLRHLCAAVPTPAPWKPEFLRYDWRKTGLWNLVFVVGLGLGGFLATTVLGTPDTGSHIAESTRGDLAALGVTSFSGLVPTDLFGWGSVLAPAGLLLILGGFLVGFGARWAGGCTSGHAISGLANLQLPSLVAVLGFFAGGLLVTHVALPVLLPLILGGAS